MAAFANTQLCGLIGEREVCEDVKLRDVQEDVSNAEMVACRQMYPR